MAKRQKSTGWKVPLLFAGCIIAAVAIIHFMFAPKKSSPDLPPEMVAFAGKVRLDLSDPEGRRLKQTITSAASGFKNYQEKDEALLKLVEKTVETGRFDAATMAWALIKADDSRRKAAWTIFAESVENCASLPWAIHAAQDLAGAGDDQTWREKLQSNWEICQNRSQKK